jgi:exopolysaccharide biosynthesis polyprenyl glycosylphosphotransferase
VVSITIIFLIRTMIWVSGWGLTDGGIAVLGELKEAQKVAQAISHPNRCPIVACLPYDKPSSLITLRAMVDAGQVEGVVLTSIPAEQQQATVSAVADLPIAVYLAPQIGLTTSSMHSVVAVLPNNLAGRGGFSKRAIDLAGATFGLLICSPLFAITALIIKLESPGPVFFRQVRFGLGGRGTEIWKFRTMYLDRGDESGESRTLARDPRVTRVGRILRRLSIDELPQFINVLQGSMSLVGPRPHVARMRVGSAFYRDAVAHYPLRHRVKPGITGWAQINGSRGEVDTMEKAERRVSLDLWYISHWSLALDIKILLRTVFGGFATFRAD